MQATWPLLTAVAVLMSAPLQGAPLTFTASLSGLEEEPPNLSPGTGSVTVIIDRIAHTLSISAWFSNLLGSTTAAHIHVINGPGDASTSDTIGPVATEVPSFTAFPIGVSSGSFSQLLDLTLASSFNPSFITASGGSMLLAEASLFDAIEQGRAYFNIHSTLFPGGEIRGFLQPVPEPATAGLATLSLVGLFAALWRRRT